MLVKYKYSGWFLFCPIYLTEVPKKYKPLEEANKEEELPNEDFPIITSRFELDWLLSLAEFLLFRVVLPILKFKSQLPITGKQLKSVRSVKNLNPMWGIKKLKTPIELVH